MTSGKRIVIATFGSFGDLHPYMSIATELKARGHDTVIATMSLYREKIEAADLRFAAIRPDVPPPRAQDADLIERIMEPKSGPKFLMEELIFPWVRDSYADLSAITQGHDLLITHPITFAGPLLAYKTGMPWVSTVLAPTSFLSAYDLPVPPFWPWLAHVRHLGPHITRLAIRMAKRGYEPKTISRFRNELGIADYGNPLFEGQHSPTRVLALFSEIFARPQPDWPRQARATGFAFYDEPGHAEMSHELRQFLNRGAAPIIFTLGSSAVWIGRDFFEQSMAAAESLGRRAVLLIGDKRNLPKQPLSPNVIAVEYAPYAQLLPKACLMVHHGGVGTTSQGLRAGIPTLIVPFAFDQSDNAEHARRLGTSRTLYRHQYKALRVAKELGILLDRPHYAQNAAVVGEVLRRENGAAKASDFIESVLDDVPDRKIKTELSYASRN